MSLSFSVFSMVFFKILHFILAERVYNFVHARIASSERFRFDLKSFYWFGIRSCLATSHKQILKTPFSITSSCILSFQTSHTATD